MDPVQEIKARLSIEELVSQYCQVTRKGRSMKALCPFHNDTHPSLIVSPDKGIAYCFACQKGGDIFSFYQQIEGVDFREALKELSDRTGVELPRMPTGSVTRDEKDRVRDCLEQACALYREMLSSSKEVLAYLKRRGVTDGEIEEFALGLAPDSFSDTYEHLLKRGFSRGEIAQAGLAVQRELEGLPGPDGHVRVGKMYDYFRARLMIPIHDAKGSIIGFGARTLKEDVAKYINSPDTSLYRKSQVLFNVHRARDAMRESGAVILVEGYFDALACVRVGIQNVVAQCGTALTNDHVRMIKRSIDMVSLMFDQDEAGRLASGRAFELCAKEGLEVRIIVLPQKDPADLALSDPGRLKTLASDGGIPYLDHVCKELTEGDIRSASGKRSALARLLPLLSSLPTATEREHYIEEAAKMLGVTEEALKDDFLRQEHGGAIHEAPGRTRAVPERPLQEFSKIEIVLGLFLLYPKHRALLKELIPPDAEGFSKALYTALNGEGDAGMPEEISERASILHLFCEQHGFVEWSDCMALREIRRNIRNANHETLQRKQEEIARALFEARQADKKAEEKRLEVQYQELIKLSRMARDRVLFDKQ